MAATEPATQPAFALSRHGRPPRACPPYPDLIWGKAHAEEVAERKKNFRRTEEARYALALRSFVTKGRPAAPLSGMLEHAPFMPAKKAPGRCDHAFLFG